MKRSRIPTVLLILVFFTGLCLLLYPKVSNYWNSFRHSTAVHHYLDDVEMIDEKAYEELLAEARKYNQSLAERTNQFKLTDQQSAAYPDLLNISDEGIMAVIDIPVNGVTLPVYHGTSTAVLQKAVGHLEWTSLPVGGESTHCVLSGHRGLPSSKLFTDLDKLVVGDVFCIRVLNETITYEVDQVLTVIPEDVTALQIIEGEDYCTLVTCTPYGVNTHRILVRGHRIENAAETQFALVTANAVQIEPLLVAPMIFTGLLLMVLLSMAFAPGKRKDKEERHEE